jgi:hypothetical protein
VSARAYTAGCRQNSYAGSRQRLIAVARDSRNGARTPGVPMKSLPSNNAAAKAVAKLTPGAAEPESLKDQARYALDEARMVLPGIQALFGFQLIAVFSDRFTHALTRTDQLLHLASVFLVALAVALVMTPAAYHRQADHQTVDRQFIRLSSTAITAAMLPLMLAIGWTSTSSPTSSWIAHGRASPWRLASPRSSSLYGSCCRTQRRTAAGAVQHRLLGGAEAVQPAVISSLGKTSQNSRPIRGALAIPRSAKHGGCAHNPLLLRAVATNNLKREKVKCADCHPRRRSRSFWSLPPQHFCSAAERKTT